MNENKMVALAENQLFSSDEGTPDRLTDRELADLMLDALRYARPDALFVGGYEEDFNKMLVLIDGNFEMVKAAQFLRDALRKADQSRP